MRLLSTIFALFLITVVSCYEDEDYIDEKVSYAVSEGLYTDFKDTEAEERPKARRGKFFFYRSYPQSPIVDLMMQTAAPNYTPQNLGDPFDFLRDQYPLPKGYTSPLSEYEYIIIGGGAAGSVLASRLSEREEKPRPKVLLLEAGRPEMLLTDVPALAHYFSRTDYAWRYSMEQQPGVCLGMENQRCPVTRGKTLGGTTVIDHMIYSRGRPEDWDRIAADGNYGWSFNDVEKYFIKAEKVDLKHVKNPQNRGRDGKLSVENVSFRTGLQEAFLDAGKENGHPTVDYNAPDGLGFGYVQATLSHGHRQSAAKAYLHPHKRRRNLHILPESRVTKILIDGNGRAYGVEYIRNRLKYTVRATREVVLSAGPVASPQLLMLSGVGPKEHLQSLGIPVLKDLKVGRTLYDHISFPGLVFTLNTSNASILEEKAATVPNLIQWIQYGEGLLSSPGSVEGIGYIKTFASKDPQPVPDVELVSVGGSIVSDGGGAIRHGMRIIDEVYNTAFGSINNRDTYSAVPVLLHPKSKGYIELKDQNPFGNPKIFGNYLTAQQDVDALVAAIRYVIKLVIDSQAFRKYSPRLHQADYLPCRRFAYGSNDYWECAIRTLTVSYRDLTGTCKMGPENDADAVVDPELRVHGIKSLRVVDPSIIPKTISGHTNGIGIMIGEKAADLIKRTWSNLVR